MVPFSLGNLGFAATFCKRKYFDPELLDPKITCFEDRVISEIVYTGLLPHLDNVTLDNGERFYNDFCGDPHDIKKIHHKLENETGCNYNVG